MVDQVTGSPIREWLVVPAGGREPGGAQAGACGLGRESGGPGWPGAGKILVDWWTEGRVWKSGTEGWQVGR